MITGVTNRSQDVQSGDLFAALPGSRAHGVTFAGAAAGAGAVAILTDPAGAAEAARTGAALPLLVVDNPRAVLGDVAAAVYGNPSAAMDIVGITGTSGKTTSSYLVQAALDADGRTTGLVGTVHTVIAGEVLPSALTTPEAPDLQALLAVMRERGVAAVAMEVSSHALALGRVSGTRFAVGAFSNLSQDHLDFHHDMESYFAAKALLFDGRAAREVINIDDEHGVRLAELRPDAVKVSAAGRPEADWAVTGVAQLPGGIQRLTVRGPSAGPAQADLALPGRFNVDNALLALACADAVGVDPALAAAAMRNVVVPGRMERVDAGQSFLAMVDYAHKPAALQAVLTAVRIGLTGRLIVVVGAGGDRDAGKRPQMGAIAAALADLVIVTDDNPRSEPPAAIRAELLAGTGSGSAQVREIGDRREAIAAAVRAADAGDAVVIAGKGHETGQEIAGVVHPFADRDELLAALNRSHR